MEFVVYTDLAELPESADLLFAQGEKESLFFSRAWFENLANTAVHDVFLACVVEGDAVLAVLPLMDCTGHNCYSLRHRYTALYSLLLIDHDQQQILECLVQGLSKAGYSSLLLEPVAESDNRLDALQGYMETSGYTCHRSFRFYNWVHQVRGQSHAEYMAGRPARLRNTIARKQRKLEREQDVEIRLFVGDEVPQAIADYYAVYGASWKAYEQYADLLDGMVAGFSKRGWSRLGILYINNQPAAAQLWFVLHGKANIFRLAYDETWKQYSPGSILTSHLMEYVIDTDRVNEIDFLVGNEAYKQDWMSERRERWALGCVKSEKPAGRFDSFLEPLKCMFTRGC